MAWILSLMRYFLGRLGDSGLVDPFVGKQTNKQTTGIEDRTGEVK